MRLQLIRNATLRLSYAGQEILVDPCLGAKGSLPSFAGISPNPTVNMAANPGEVLDSLDLVLISHLHPDHFDQEAEALLPKRIPIFCQPSDLTTLQSKGFAEAVGLETAALWNGISITPTPGQHGRGEILMKTGSVMGFFMRAAGEPTVYLAGDTVLTADVLEVIRNEKLDVIVTHSGGANIGGDLIIMDDSETIERVRPIPIRALPIAKIETVVKFPCMSFLRKPMSSVPPNRCITVKIFSKERYINSGWNPDSLRNVVSGGDGHRFGVVAPIETRQ